MDDKRISRIKKKYSKDFGSFVIIDYKILGEVKFAKGKLIGVTEEGKLEVQHVYNPKTRWEVDPSGIINYSIRPLKKKGGKV